jgi:hypothetical protein
MTTVGNWCPSSASRSQIRSELFHGNVESSYEGRGVGKMRRSMGDMNKRVTERTTLPTPAPHTACGLCVDGGRASADVATPPPGLAMAAATPQRASPRLTRLA